MAEQDRVRALLARYIACREGGEDPPDPAVLCEGDADVLGSLRALIREYEELESRMAAPEAAARLGVPFTSPAGTLAAETESDDRMLTAVDSSSSSKAAFEIGRIVDDRYRIDARLGRGGMGEVWRAFDLSLQVDVALKTLSLETQKGDGATYRRELPRREVRAARQVISPNVCRIFDLVVVDGQELVSMEYIDGQTLTEMLQSDAALELPAAADIASQLLAGLEAIHRAGLVHRDIKPANVMVTRAGRVVVMDFGLALPALEGHTVVGTPPYMPPEQLRGGEVDARSDVFAAGVLLAELISRAEILDQASREGLWSGIRESPPVLPESPWREVLLRAVDADPDKRYRSARAVARALEEVTLRAEGPEGRTPYPGLAAFTAADTEYFFGREAEVEAVAKKLDRPRLQAIIGPSGTGKSSFLRAGLLPALDDDWGCVVCHPGSAPMQALGQALAPELTGDTQAVRDLVSFEQPDVALSVLGRWRHQYKKALLIVDQFEELFTLNGEEAEAQFSHLLGRAVLEADVVVLLSMRDDFLYQCQAQPALQPVFAGLTAIGPLSGEALRRALVQPALLCGYRFEDEDLIEEMVSEVSEERGALPLLAFAAQHLWERRDRDRGLLTREAYQEIGGVGGALAQHAEATLQRIGNERQPLVRELLRNLVTAEGTRASRSVRELMSLFGRETERPEAESPETGGPETGREVLRALIDARLLTEYEVATPEGSPEEEGQRVEIIHESLLSAWPRLVRWQTQDADGAQLRDQLRQAAQLWEEKARTSDLLWTGTAFAEFELWRERYPGALTVVEEEFARSMVEHARRRIRRRRAVTTAVVMVALAVAAVTGTLWRQARTEALRSEAGQLLALGQTHLEDDPTVALAYARASLELLDTPEARRFAVEALWSGPVARILPAERMEQELGLPEDLSATLDLAFSPDGRSLATRKESNRRVMIFPRDGGPARALPRQPDGNTQVLEFGPGGELLVTGGSGESLRFWSLPELREIRSVDLGGVGSSAWVRGGKLLTRTRISQGEPPLWRWWPLPTGDPTALGRFSIPGGWGLDPGGVTLAYGQGRSVRVRPLDPADPSPERVLGQSRDDVRDVTFSPRGDRLASLDRSGEIRIWSLTANAGAPIRVLDGPRQQAYLPLFEPDGRLLTQLGANAAVTLWDLDGPPEARAVVVRPWTPGPGTAAAFEPGGQWLAASYGAGTLFFWPLRAPAARALGEVSSAIWYMAFTNDSRWLATCALGQPARLWPLAAADGRARDLAPAEPCASLAMHPTRDELLVGTQRGDVVLYPIAGGSPRRLPGGWEGAAQAMPVAIDRQGRRVLASPDSGGRAFEDPRLRVLRTWDLESWEERVHSVAHLTDANFGYSMVAFAADGSVYGLRGKGGNVLRLVLPTEPGGEISSEIVFMARTLRPSMSRDGRLLLVATSESPDNKNLEFEELHLFDLEDGASRRVTTHGARLGPSFPQFDASARAIVTGDVDGTVRVGPVTGEEPHLLLGHESMILSLAVSPDGRWIASATDESLRLWPMPDLSKPPLHTLPRAELLAKLDALTNLRVVRDPASETGWKFEIGPFPGWEEVPTW